MTLVKTNYDAQNLMGMTRDCFDYLLLYTLFPLLAISFPVEEENLAFLSFKGYNMSRPNRGRMFGLRSP